MSDKEWLDALRKWRDMFYVRKVHQLQDPALLVEFGQLTDAIVKEAAPPQGSLGGWVIGWGDLRPLHALNQKLIQKQRNNPAKCVKHPILWSGNLSLSPNVCWNPSEAEIEEAAHAAIGVCDRLIAQLSRVLEPPDGPAPPNLLWWKGEKHELKPRLWQILNCLWHRTEPLAISELAESVWGDSDAIKDGTVRSQLSALNRELGEIGIPQTYHIKRSYIVCDLFSA